MANDRSMYVYGHVVDAQSGKSIDQFRLIVGSPYNHIHTSWQSHLAFEHTGGQYEWSVSRAWRKTRLRIEAEGYQPGISPVLERKAGTPGKMKINFKLRRDPGISGTVADSRGHAVPGAQVALTTHTLSAMAQGGELSYQNGTRLGASIIKTDDQGRFQLPAESDPFLIVVAHRQHGFAVIPKGELARGQRAIDIQLQPWCRIEGTCLDQDGKPDANARYAMWIGWQPNQEWPILYHRNQAMTDETGSFVCAHVAPGRHYLQRWDGDRPTSGWSLEAIAGKTMRLNVGTQTRTIEGRLLTQSRELPPGFDFSALTLIVSPEDPQRVRPPVIFANGKRVRQGVPITKQGTFVIEGLPPGRYEGFVEIRPGAEASGFRFRLNQKLNVPLVDVADQQTPHDCGDLTILMRPITK